MLRRLLVVFSLLAALALGAALARGPAVRHLVRKKMDEVALRLGQPLSAGRIEPEGAGGVRLSDVRLGPPGAPVLAAREIDAWAPPKAILKGQRTPDRVTVRDFTVQIQGDGTPRGLLEAVKRLRPPPAASSAEPAAPAARPLVILRGGRFVDTGGFAVATGIAGRITPESRFLLDFQLEAPSPSPCRLEGTAERLELTCASPVALPVRPGVSLEIPRLAVQRAPTAEAEIRGARLRGDGLPEALVPYLDGLGFDAQVGLDETPDTGRRPLKAALTFPAGGRIEATGTVGPGGAELRTEVSHLDLTPISRTLAGESSAKLTLTVDVEKRRADLSGQVQLDHLLVDHRAIADDKIGPYSLGIEGEIGIEQLATPEPPPPVEGQPPEPPPPPRVRLTLTRGLVRMGDLAVRTDAALEADTRVRKVTARVDAGRFEASQLVSAFPPGLMPHLQPLQATGWGFLKFDVNLDMDQPEKTDLQVEADFKHMEVTRLNPAIDLETLRTTFETHFEMPDGEVIRNVTGPESERWTPLDQVAPLLPIAIVAQEDGGFWNHKGISLLHLRGSLQANVEKGRFARGGSTLTMQLARNIFLNHRKTLSRKMEEVVVAWLLEQNLTKQELMELYLNVVEFGPHLFGIGDATMHYFKKKPAELTPVEVAFLARLLPAPRRFHEQFEKGEVKEYYAASMMRLLGLLVERGHLSRQDFESADPRTLFARPM